MTAFGPGFIVWILLAVPLYAGEVIHREGYEFYSREKVKPGQVVEMALEPGAVKVYVFGAQ